MSSLKFIPDQEIDERKAKLKEEYDNTFMARKKPGITPDELKKLNARMRRLEEISRAFVKRHALYFSRERYHIFENIENRGVFGDRPKFEDNKRIRDVVCTNCGEVFEHFTVHRKDEKKELCRFCESRMASDRGILNRKRGL